MAIVKETIGQDKYEEIREFLQWAFPGAPPPDDATVDGAARALYRKHGPALQKAGFPEQGPPALDAESEEAAGRGLADAYRYPLYIANATHHRVRSMTNPDLGSKSNTPFESEFTGHLPVVRVTLPQSFGTGTNPNIRTQIGDVYLSTDHLVGSVQLITQKFGSQLGYTPGRVDLVTPARTGLTHSRFAAIAVYLGYRNATDASPSFYILEAGMATGQPMMIYFAPTMATVITQQSGYLPTAYSSPDNFYKGQLTVQNDQPSFLWVQAIPPNSQYYIQVSVVYQSTTSTSNDPFELLVQAAMRVALIGQRMGVPSGVPLQGVMAELALTLDWAVKPNYGGPGTIPSTAPAEREMA